MSDEFDNFGESSSHKHSRGDRSRGDRGDRGDKGDRGDRGTFTRKKVCPFILDKTLLLDFKNLRVVQRFITETGRIVPRHISGVSAKNQRKLTKQIKRARNLGLIAPHMEG
jgi:small subunit ribosomal protein S18